MTVFLRISDDEIINLENVVSIKHEKSTGQLLFRTSEGAKGTIGVDAHQTASFFEAFLKRMVAEGHLIQLENENV